MYTTHISGGRADSSIRFASLAANPPTGTRYLPPPLLHHSSTTPPPHTHTHARINLPVHAPPFVSSPRPGSINWPFRQSTFPAPARHKTPRPLPLSPCLLVAFQSPLLCVGQLWPALASHSLSRPLAAPSHLSISQPPSAFLLAFQVLFFFCHLDSYCESIRSFNSLVHPPAALRPAQPPFSHLLTTWCG